MQRSFLDNESLVWKTEIKLDTEIELTNDEEFCYILSDPSIDVLKRDTCDMYICKYSFEDETIRNYVESIIFNKSELIKLSKKYDKVSDLPRNHLYDDLEQQFPELYHFTTSQEIEIYIVPIREINENNGFKDIIWIKQTWWDYSHLSRRNVYFFLPKYQSGKKFIKG